MLSPPGVSLLPTYKVITSPAATGFADIDSGNWDWEYRWSSGAGVQPNPESSSVDEHAAAIRMIIRIRGRIRIPATIVTRSQSQTAGLMRLCRISP